jgi:hypothetical protein
MLKGLGIEFFFSWFGPGWLFGFPDFLAVRLAFCLALSNSLAVWLFACLFG